MQEAMHGCTSLISPPLIQADGMAKSIRLFEQASHAQLYSKYRPTYPSEIMSTICSYIKKRGSGFGLVVDVACGSGQSSFHLLDHFERCTGVDISEAQVNEARKKAADYDASRITFHVGDSSGLPVASESVDLVGCGQAWHWLETDSFYREVSRVLKPSGAIAVYGYGNCRPVNAECAAKVSSFYGDTLKGYWHSNRQLIDREYRDVELPFTETERHDFAMPMSFPLTHFIGYVSSWSGYCNYMESHPGSQVLGELGDALRQILLRQSKPAAVTGDREPIVEVVFPVFLNLGLKR